MGSIGKNGGTVTPSTGSRSKIQEVSRHSENTNPNLNDSSISPVPKPSKSSPSIKSSKAAQKSAAKNPTLVLNSPRYKIRERKFVVAKKNSKREKSGSDAKKCLSTAYETLRASQEEFFKNQSGAVEENEESEQFNGSIRAEIELEEEMERKLMIEDLQVEDKVDDEHEGNGASESPEQVSNSMIKRRRERLLETARNSVPETGSGKVKHLVMAFEKLRTIQVPKESDQNEEKQSENAEKPMEEKKKVMKWALPGLPPPAVLETQTSSSSFCPSELFLTSENLGLDPRISVSSSWDGSHGRLVCSLITFFTFVFLFG